MAAFSVQQPTQVFTTHSNAWHFRPGETPIDTRTYWRNIFMMRKSTYPGALFLALMQKVFQVFPEFHKNGSALTLSEEFHQMISFYWLPQASDMILELLCMGIVAVRYTQLKKGSETRIPVVMRASLGYNYTITVFQDPLTGVIEYTYYRLKMRDGTLLDRPIKDANVRIFSGFGFDPTPQGDVVSPVSLLFDEEQYKRLNMRFSTTALFNQSRPTIITQTAPDSEGVMSSGSLIGFYGSSAGLREESRRAYQLNATELAAVFEQNRTFFANYGAESDMSLPLFKRQAEGNIMPLPVGHQLVQQPAPVHRGDMAAMERTYQDYASAVLGIPRPVVMGESGVTQSSSAEIVIETTSETTNVWRSRLSRVWTEMYEDLYSASDKQTALADLSYEEFLALTPHKFKEKVKHTKVEVVFRFVSKDTLDSLLTKYVVGIITWKEMVQSARTLASQDSSHETDFPLDSDPWSQLEKLTAVKARTTALTQKLGEMGNAVFPAIPKPTAGAGDGKSSSSSGEKKKKKKKKEKKPTAGKKRKSDGKKSERSEEKKKQRKEKAT